MVSQTDYQNLHKFYKALQQNPTNRVVPLLQTVFPERPDIHAFVLDALGFEVQSQIFVLWADRHTATEVLVVAKRALILTKKLSYTARYGFDSGRRSQQH